MIFDSLKNIGFYRGLNDRYAKAVEFLLQDNLQDLDNGKYEIDGTDVYANVMEYDTIPWEEASYEAHKHYTDIQCILAGEELMSFEPTVNLIPAGEYNESKDVIKFNNEIRGIDFVVRAGEYLIFQPQDGHKPKAMNQTSSRVKKVVVKIKED
jgi:YhcH/YjgK/YiaL family protein